MDTGSFPLGENAARKNLRQCKTTFLSRIPGHQQALDFSQPGLHLNSTAAVDHYDMLIEFCPSVIKRSCPSGNENYDRHLPFRS